jgi:hypothetical protein
MRIKNTLDDLCGWLPHMITSCGKSNPVKVFDRFIACVGGFNPCREGNCSGTELLDGEG